MARSRSEPKPTEYVLPDDHSVSPNEQMFSISSPPADGRTTMLATPGVPFTAESLGLTDEEFVTMCEESGLPFEKVLPKGETEPVVEPVAEEAETDG